MRLHISTGAATAFALLAAMAALFLACPLPSFLVEGKRCRAGECPSPYECVGLSAEGEGFCRIRDGSCPGGDGRVDFSRSVSFLDAAPGSFEVARLGGGYAVVAVDSSDGGARSVYLQRFDAQFAPLGTRRVLTAPGVVGTRVAIAESSGGVLVAWAEQATIQGTRIVVSAIDADGLQQFLTPLGWQSAESGGTALALTLNRNEFRALVAWNETEPMGLVAATVNVSGGAITRAPTHLWDGGTVAALDVAASGGNRFALGFVGAVGREVNDVVFFECDPDLVVRRSQSSSSDGGIGPLSVANRRRPDGGSDVSAVWVAGVPQVPDGPSVAVLISHDPFSGLPPEAVAQSKSGGVEIFPSLSSVGVSPTEIFVVWAVGENPGLAAVKGALSSAQGGASGPRELLPASQAAMVAGLVPVAEDIVSVVVSEGRVVRAMNVCVR